MVVSGERWAVGDGWWAVGGGGQSERTGQVLKQLLPSRCGFLEGGQLLFAHASALHDEHCEARGPVHAWQLAWQGWQVRTSGWSSA